MRSQSTSSNGHQCASTIERRRDGRRQTVRVRLIRKLADHLDGIDLSKYNIGDVFNLPRREAELLIREGWAVIADSASTLDIGQSTQRITNRNRIVASILNGDCEPLVPGLARYQNSS